MNKQLNLISVCILSCFFSLQSLSLEIESVEWTRPEYQKILMDELLKEQSLLLPEDPEEVKIFGPLREYGEIGGV